MSFLSTSGKCLEVGRLQRKLAGEGVLNPLTVPAQIPAPSWLSGEPSLGFPGQPGGCRARSGLGLLSLAPCLAVPTRFQAPCQLFLETHPPFPHIVMETTPTAPRPGWVLLLDFPAFGRLALRERSSPRKAPLDTNPGCWDPRGQACAEKEKVAGRGCCLSRLQSPPPWQSRPGHTKGALRSLYSLPYPPHRIQH